MTQPNTSGTTQAAQAVTYAQNLGLDAVYHEALEAERELAQAGENLRHWSRTKRETQDKIDDRRIALASNLRAQQPSMSATAFEQWVKAPLRADAELARLRDELTTASENLEACEHDQREKLEMIKLRSARLTELGGYFTYLAAVRNATTTQSKP